MIYTVTIILALELIRCILKLIYEKKKYETSKKEIPLLLDNKDSLAAVILNIHIPILININRILY